MELLQRKQLLAHFPCLQAPSVLGFDNFSILTGATTEDARQQNMLRQICSYMLEWVSAAISPHG